MTNLVERARRDSVVEALIQNGSNPGSGIQPIFTEEGARRPKLVDRASSESVVAALIQNGSKPGNIDQPEFTEGGARRG
jgi:hypothetical protein